MSHDERPPVTVRRKGTLLHQVLSLCIDLRLISLVPGLGSHVSRTFAAALASSAASITFLFFVSIFISGLIDGKDPAVLLPAGAGMGCMLVLRIAAEVYRERSAHATAGIMKRSIRSLMYKKLLGLGPAYTDRNDSGTIAAIFVDGIEQLEQYVSYYIPYILLCLLVPACLFVAFASLVDIVTALILLACVPLVPVIIILSNRPKRLEKTDVWGEWKRMSAFYAESLQGLPTLKLFNQQGRRAGEIRKKAERFSQTYIRRLRFALLVSFAADMVPYLGYGSALLYVCIRMSGGTMQTGQVMFVLLLGPVFYEHVIHLGQYYHSSVNAKSTINSILSLIEANPLVTGPEHPVQVSLPPPRSVRFRNVSFAYEPGRPVLRDCSFSLGEGEMVALVGASGVGKSTIVDLLFRYYDPDEGEIEICEVPIRDIPFDLLRQQFALVSQDTYLFSGTIRENLLFGSPDASDDEVQEAIEISRLSGFIDELPEGFETKAGERGMRLSGGERQRIAIGRAVLKDAPILILDEPTASVDAESERHIREAVKKLLSGRMVFVIAHRLSTIRDATRILVMDGGRIVESGTHADLIKQNGRYAELVRAQVSSGLCSGQERGVAP